MDTEEIRRAGGPEPVRLIGRAQFACAFLGATATLCLVLAVHASATIVVVGDQGTILTSPTGTSWTAQSSGTLNSIRGITDDGSVMVAVGDAGTILSSSDGVVWTSQTSGTTQNLRDVAFSGGVWIAVGDNGMVLRSTNSVSWVVEPTPPGTQTFQDVATDGTQWVAVGNVHTIETSPDGVTWTNRLNTAPGHLDAVTNYGGKWLATGDSETVLTSSNAVTWSKQTLSPGTSGDYLWGVTHAGSQWVIVDASRNVYTSPDAVTWTLHATPATTQLFTVRQDSGQYVAVGGTTGSNALITSPDAATWTTQTPGTMLALEDIDYRPTPPPLDCSPSTQRVPVGAGAALTSGGGKPPYTWTAPGGNNPGPVTGNSFSPAYAAPGTYTIGISDGSSPQQSSSCQVVVAAPLACAPSTQAALVGDTVTLSATGGTPPYTWTAPESSDPGPADGAAFTTIYGKPNKYDVTLTDSGSQPQSSTCDINVNDAAPPPDSSSPPQTSPQVVAPPPPTLTCRTSSDGVTVGENVTFFAGGGTPPYSWEAPGSTTPGPTAGTTMTTAYRAANVYSVILTDAGGTRQSTYCTVRVNAAPASVGTLGTPTAPLQEPESLSQSHASTELAAGPNLPAGGTSSPTDSCTVESSTGPALSRPRPDDANDSCPTQPSPSRYDLRNATEVRPQAFAQVGTPRAKASTWVPPMLVAAMGAILALLATREVKIVVWIISMFTRLRRAQLLDHPVRSQIYAAVKEQPGIHLREIMRTIEREKGVVRHHLDILAEGNLLHCQISKANCRWFVTEIEDPRVMQALVAVRSKGARTVMRAILSHPGTTLENLSATTGLAYAAVGQCVRRLRAAKLVVTRRQGKILHLSPSGLAGRVLGFNADDFPAREMTGYASADSHRTQYTKNAARQSATHD